MVNYRVEFQFSGLHRAAPPTPNGELPLHKRHLSRFSKDKSAVINHDISAMLCSQFTTSPESEQTDMQASNIPVLLYTYRYFNPLKLDTASMRKKPVHALTICFLSYFSHNLLDIYL